MEVTLLGTGSSDGWPNAFCRCRSCAAARVEGAIRTPSSALVDRTLLLDPGPALSGQVAAAAVDLEGVHTVLVTHAHADHLDPSFLMHRGWVTDAPLTVAGPPPAIARCREWLDPDADGVRLVELAAGNELAVAGGVRVLALPAHHEAFGPALLYAISTPGGSLLYATDTGVWVDAAASLLAGLRFDLVVMEETFGDRPDLGEQHLALASFESEVGRLRALGCVDDRTTVLATHLSHHNPPPDVLRRRLQAAGADTVPEGTTVRVGVREGPRTPGP